VFIYIVVVVLFILSPKGKGVASRRGLACMDGGALPLTAFDLISLVAGVYILSNLWRWLLSRLPDPSPKKNQ
tara:strand:- start:178 stop:393 length:216 start_codon:yes stop_codon:yes gene_type:complete